MAWWVSLSFWTRELWGREWWTCKMCKMRLQITHAHHWLQPRPQGFSLKKKGGVRFPPHPFFKGKALGTRLHWLTGLTVELSHVNFSYKTFPIKKIFSVIPCTLFIYHLSFNESRFRPPNVNCTTWQGFPFTCLLLFISSSQKLVVSRHFYS